ncbi:MAG: hypothetical protein V4723_21885 [Pseudomonadota bacterium]
MTTPEMFDDLLEQMETLLRNNGEHNWIRGVVAARNCLRAEDPKAFDEARRVIRDMSSGAGSFSDYYVHHEDFEIRQSLNRPLDELKAAIWKLAY